jgi:hypothetical protein
VTQPSGGGQSSFDIAETYRLRMSLDKFKKENFSGLEESIECLSRDDVTVHLCVVESENGVIALWLTDHSSVPVSVVVIKSKVRA